jgi:TolB-like protein/Tfp pilus assembly protein PilF
VGAALLLSSSLGVGATRRAVAPIRSVALLDLVNLTGDPERDHLAEALTEGLRNDLARARELRVTSKKSAVHYDPGARKSVRELAAELGVDGLVEGAVVRAGDRVRVAMQLIDVRTESHAWAETFEEEAGAIPALQAAVARALMDQLRVELRPEDKLRLARARPVHPEAYRAYALGHFFTSRRTVEGVLRGVDHFSESIARDPGYAPAHAGLAEAYALAAEHQFLPVGSTLQLARAAAEMALELDPDLAEGHQSLAAILQAEWDWEGAEAHLERALELTPGAGGAHRRYGEFLSRRGRHQEAIAHVQRARDLDPVSLASNAALGAAYRYAGRLGEAVEQLRATVQLDPHFAAAQLLLGQAYEAMGRHSDAIGVLATAVRLSAREPATVASLARAQALGGAAREARAVLPELQAWVATGRASSFQLAMVLSALGDRDRAMAMLERAYEERSPDLAYLGSGTVLPELRGDPRVAALLSRMGLADPGPVRRGADCPPGGKCDARRPCAADGSALERISVSDSGAESTGSALPDLPSMSRDGRLVAFASDAPNLVSGDTNGVADVFVRDTCRTTAGPVPSCRPGTRRASLPSAGGQSREPSRNPFLSGDGRYVVFATRAALEARRGGIGASHSWNLYRVELGSGRAELVNAVEGAPHGPYVSPPSPVVSRDGRFVAWSNPTDPGELLVRDMELDSLEVAAHRAVGRPALSDDGRYVAFVSLNPYDPEDDNRAADVYLLDRWASTFARVTRAAGAGSVRGDLGLGMSGDGKLLAYVTRDDRVDDDGAVDSNGALDVYLHDLSGPRPRVRLVSAAFGRAASQSPFARSSRPYVSADGRAVAFESTAKDLVHPGLGIRDPHPQIASPNVFVRDLATGRTRQVSVGPCGEGANELFAGTRPGVSLSGDGTLVAFLSLADNLVRGDRNASLDVFAVR